MNEKNPYVTPELEVILLEKEDIIITSVNGENNELDPDIDPGSIIH